MKKFFTIVVVILVVLIGVRFAINKNKKKGEVKEEVYKGVVCAIPSKGELEIGVEYTGMVHALPESYVFSPVPARFVKYHVKTGQYVKKDQLIATLERDVPGMKFSPVRVESPINGYVIALPLISGSMVNPQMPVAIVGGKKRVIEMYVSPSDIEKIKNSKFVEVYIPDMNKKVDGKLYSVDEGQNLMRGGCGVKVEFDEDVPTGLIAKCKFVFDKLYGFRIRSEDIVNDNLAVVKGGKIHFIPADVKGSFRGISIVDGLSDKDTLVVKGEDVCSEGEIVNIKGWEEDYAK